MNALTSAAVATAAVACTFTMQPSTDSGMAGTYENLATAIIAIRHTEDSLVSEMLSGYHESARMHLQEAAASTVTRMGHLEEAAMQITNLANEGDKPVQAIRQRLLKAGHHHHTDADTQEDYIFIDSGEKRTLLSLAGRVAQMSRGSSDDIESAAQELADLFAKAMAED